MFERCFKEIFDRISPAETFIFDATFREAKAKVTK
jgi:hypothetical protein